jgi:beta-aspartyl-peptidase (threonine type)
MNPTLRALILAALLALAGEATGSAPTPAYSYYELGDVRSPTHGRPHFGLLLVGGGDWDKNAIRWFAKRAGNGHIVIISASYGAEPGEEFYREASDIASVQTIEFKSRSASFDPHVLSILRHADGIFISGGDQAKYVRFWKGTPVARLLDAHVRAAKPLGGTSAGLAIMGASGYGAMDGGSVNSAAALADPGGPAVSMVHDFLHLPFLSHIVTDTHFTARNRLGRLIAFVAQVKATRDPCAVGLGIDQGGALAVGSDGVGRLFGPPGGYAWLIEPEGVPSLARGRPLELARVKISGVGAGGTINLLTLAIARPAFSKTASVLDGKLANAPTPPR